MPLEGIHVDNKLQFVEELVEIMEREIKRLKQSRIPLVKVRWNSRRGPEFTWDCEDSFKKEYPHLFTNRALQSTTRRIKILLENGRVGGVTQAFQSFEDMLKDFDRKDLDALRRITKEKFSTAMPIQNKEKALWAELTRLNRYALSLNAFRKPIRVFLGLLKEPYGRILGVVFFACRMMGKYQEYLLFSRKESSSKNTYFKLSGRGLSSRSVGDSELSSTVIAMNSSNSEKKYFGGGFLRWNGGFCFLHLEEHRNILLRFHR
nr:putative reverse transcriptase domain-containing protein [Tanacetum cinerariifolium]